MPTLPLTLAPSEGFEVGVEYARDVHGQHYSPLFFQAAGEPYPLLVPLLAESNHEGLMSDRFIQGADRLLDVLFVVSNTTTMGPYQDRLAAEVPGWIDAARAAGVELNVGVTSTGLVARDRCTAGARGGEAGRLIPVDGSRARIVTSGRDDAVSALQSNLDVGVCHDLVQGLETMRSALSSPLVDSADDPRTVEPDDGNLGFLRPAARLSVVVLADEDDKSGFGPDAYAQLIDSIKGPNMSHRTELHAIVPTDPSCDSAGPPGARFSGVAEQTGGEVLDVCGGDYAGLLDQIMGSAAGPQRSFQLTDSPVEDEPIEVRVDGEIVSGWSYDEEANAIVFEEGAIPAAGETVEVRYRSTC